MMTANDDIMIINNDIMSVHDGTIAQHECMCLCVTHNVRYTCVMQRNQTTPFASTCTSRYQHSLQWQTQFIIEGLRNASTAEYKEAKVNSSVIDNDQPRVQRKKCPHSSEELHVLLAQLGVDVLHLHVLLLVSSRQLYTQPSRHWRVHNYMKDTCF